MSYAVHNLRPGMVILCQAPAREPIWGRLLDEVIAWSSGPFVHAAMVGDNELIEQIAPVVTSPLRKYANNGWAFTVDGMTPEKAQGMVRWAFQRLGQAYGYRAILEDGAMLDLHDWNMLKIHARYLTCSGFVERAARCGAGIPLSEMPLPTPTALAFSPLLIGARPWSSPTPK